MSEEEVSSAASQPDGASFDMAASHLRDMVGETVRMETGRCESLRKMSGTLLTGSSILSVALLTVAAPLFGFFAFDASLQRALLVSYALVLAALLASIVLSVVSQLRFGYQALPSPEQLRAKIDDGVSFTAMEAARSMAKPMESVWRGLSKRNDIMRGLLTASAVCVFVAAGVIVISTALLFPAAFSHLAGTC